MRTRRTQAITIGAVALLAWSTPARAQSAGDGSGARQVAQITTDRLKSELQLTADQVPKVEQINLKTANALKALIEKYAADTTAASDAAFVRGTLDVLRSNQYDLQQVLTPAQWTKHQQQKASRIALNQTEVMAEDLDLSSEQILEVERINLKAAQGLVKVLDQPKGAPMQSRNQRFAAAKPVLQKRDAALERVLTAAQFKEMQANRRALHDLLVQETMVAVAPSGKH